MGARVLQDRPPTGWLLEYQTPRSKEWKPCTPVIAYDSSQAVAAATEALREEGIKKWLGIRVKKLVEPRPQPLKVKRKQR